MIKEEYQKTLIRMWDSIRDDESKMGQPNCNGVPCDKCPLYEKGKLCYSRGFSEASYKVYDIIAKVEKWLEYNPLKTNGTEFLKKFPNAQFCGNGQYGITMFVKLDRNDPDDGNIIEVNKRWWNEKVEDDADCD